MYGADSNKSVRFGKYDATKYYPTPYINQDVGTYLDFLAKWKNYVRKEQKNILADLH